MRPLIIFLLALCSSAATAQTNARDAAAIAATLRSWNAALKARDVAAASSVFDNSPHTMMVGSSPGEKFRGKEMIRNVLSMFLANSEIALDLSNATIDQNGNTAWVFIEGTIRVQENSGVSSESPYRISIVLVRRASNWKWRFFHGEIPRTQGS